MEKEVALMKKPIFIKLMDCKKLEANKGNR